jgi:hypothetical protein
MTHHENFFFAEPAREDSFGEEQQKNAACANAVHHPCAVANALAILAIIR